MKLKTLPSQTERQRYVFFRVRSSRRLDFSEARNAINDALLTWMGNSGFAKAKPWVIRNLWNANEGVIQCTHRYVDDVKMGLALIHQIGDARVIFHTVRVSGTLKAGQAGVRKQ